MNKLLMLTISLSICFCIPPTDSKRPTNLNDAKTHADSIYVIDYEYKNQNGNTKPPCSTSPNPCGCMENRINELGLTNFKY